MLDKMIDFCCLSFFLLIGSGALVILVGGFVTGGIFGSAFNAYGISLVLGGYVAGVLTVAMLLVRSITRGSQ